MMYCIPNKMLHLVAYTAMFSFTVVHVSVRTIDWVLGML